jgi:hypothetical protein
MRLSIFLSVSLSVHVIVDLGFKSWINMFKIQILHPLDLSLSVRKLKEKIKGQWVSDFKK